MKSQKSSLLFLADGGIKLTWLYAWATFIMVSILHRPFPLPEAIGTFVLATLLTLVVLGRGLQVILILGLQGLGFLLAVSRIVHVFFYKSLPFFDQWWLLTCFRQLKNPMEWFIPCYCPILCPLVLGRGSDLSPQIFFVSHHLHPV